MKFGNATVPKPLLTVKLLSWSVMLCGWGDVKIPLLTNCECEVSCARVKVIPRSKMWTVIEAKQDVKLLDIRVCACVCVCVCMRACMSVCVCAYACVCVRSVLLSTTGTVHNYRCHHFPLVMSLNLNIKPLFFCTAHQASTSYSSFMLNLYSLIIIIFTILTRAFQLTRELWHNVTVRLLKVGGQQIATVVDGLLGLVSNVGPHLELAGAEVHLGGRLVVVVQQPGRVDCVAQTVVILSLSPSLSYTQTHTQPHAHTHIHTPHTHTHTHTHTTCTHTHIRTRTHTHTCMHAHMHAPAHTRTMTDHGCSCRWGRWERRTACWSWHSA